MIRGHVPPHARGGGAYVHRPCKVIGLFFKGLFEATIFFTVEKGLKEWVRGLLAQTIKNYTKERMDS